MALPAELTDLIQKSIPSDHRSEVHIQSCTPLGGGDINQAYRINTTAGPYFVKINSASRYPGMFEKEAAGLHLIASTGEIRVPQVIFHGQAGDDICLVLEYIHSAPRKASFWSDFGRSLARMHKHSSESFGLDHHNYMGAIPQSNRRHQTWNEFFILERLEPMVMLARNDGFLIRDDISAFERLYRKLPDIFPVEPPALIHGDLWTGNHMVDKDGNACLIDPAVYYGHREMDIAISRLFGSFATEFYETYHAEYPLEKGWKERVEVCNLYPLLVHVNLFGEGYLGSVERTILKFK
jgi:protein-ribulosamine 3-kinase